MKKTVTNLSVIVGQLLIVVLFFVIFFYNNGKLEKYVTTVKNENLDKIAKSVSVLFEDEKIPFDDDNSVEVDDMTILELPSSDSVNKEVPKVVEENNKDNEKVFTPLVSVDASKYTSNESMGFKVTEGNKTYSLNDYEFDVVVAVITGEFDKNLNDALGVVSVILNRCDSQKWSSWAGNSPYKQVIKAGQFEVYFAGMYKKYMPGGSEYGSEKYNIAKQALLDGLNGIRNNNYLGFRAWWVSGYSSKYIVSGGNRYGYN